MKSGVFGGDATNLQMERLSITSPQGDGPEFEASLPGAGLIARGDDSIRFTAENCADSSAHVLNTVETRHSIRG